MPLDPAGPAGPADPATPAPPAGRSRLEELTARARRVVGPAQAAPAPAASPAAPPAAIAGGAAGAVYLGVDPGTATTGYGFVRAGPEGSDRLEAVAFGVVLTGAGEAMPQRLLTLYRSLSALIAAHRPVEAAVEKLYFGRNTTTAISVGQARGVVLLVLAEAGIPVAEYTPAEVKQATAGFGRAQKSQMQRMTQALLDLPALPQPDDAADALGIAICHLRLSRLRAVGLPY